MKSNKIILILLSGLMLFSACEKLLEPENDNHSTLDRVYGDPTYAEGLLMTAYSYIPTNSYRWDDVATDDAVTNDKFNSYLRIATGEWSSLYNPQDLWGNGNLAILYINQFLSLIDSVQWKWTDKTLNDLYIRRLSGESYALRGLFKYFLLRNHAGFSDDGTLLGIPDCNKFLETQEDFESPRLTFAESVQSAYDDFDKALELLPMDYGDVNSNEELPANFKGVSDYSDYNTTNGDYYIQRMSGRHVVAFEARLALLAASPAFNTGNDATLWENAANYAGKLLTDYGGPNALDPDGNLFYLKDQVNKGDVTKGNYIKEILWRRPMSTNRSRESNNFPPSLFGNGDINPTQNLVDAFPMLNGYPIDDEVNSGYDKTNPYNNRDPRLSQDIVFNGSMMKSNIIHTSVDGGDDGLDALVNSTRTGYYLRKLLREDCNCDPSHTSDQKHYETHIRYTELFLLYAEAANEVWGPDGTGTFSFSARDVISAIRERAGLNQPDAYLASISSKEAMRTLIHNERRLELCFESFRFWDIRRWKNDLTIPAIGVRIEDGDYTRFTVEERAYDNAYMNYGPIPDSDVLKFGIIQNQGWN